MVSDYLGYKSASTIEYKKYFMATSSLAKEYGKYKANTAEENAKLFEQYAETNDPAIREALILGNLKIAMKIAYRYISSDAAYDFDDILQVAILGLIKAIDTFDYRKGYTFTTYGMKVIASQINILFRRIKYAGLILSLDAHIAYNEKGEGLTAGEILVDENINIEDDVERVIMCSLIESELNCLTEKERNIIIDKFGLYCNKPLLQRELAVKYNYSQGYICRILAGAINKLRDRLLSTV